MNDIEKEHIQSLISTLGGWKLSGANSAVAYHIMSSIITGEKDKVRITVDDFIYETHYCRASVVKALRYLSDRCIILKETDPSDNKGYMYSIVVYEMQDEEKMEKTMTAYKKNGNGYASWNSLPSPKKEGFTTKYLGVDVDEWTYDDFSFFLQDFIKHCSKNWKLDISDVNFVFASSFRRNQTFVNIVDYLHENSGGNYCKLMLKAYLQWATENLFRKIIVDEVKPSKGMKQFSLGHLFHKSYMQQFLDDHGITLNMKSSKSVEAQLANYRRVVEKKTDSSKPLHSLTPNDMKEYYGVGISTLLTECGIVLAGNYLMVYENKSFPEAAKEINDFLGNLNTRHAKQKDALKKIVEKTCMGSPYYQSMKFLNWFVIYEEIFKKLGNQFDKSGFQITASKKRNSYSYFTDKEKIEA